MALYDTEPPGGRPTDASSTAPSPCAAQVPPFAPVQVQVTREQGPEKVTVTVAESTGSPAVSFCAVMTKCVGRPGVAKVSLTFAIERSADAPVIATDGTTQRKVRPASRKTRARRAADESALQSFGRAITLEVYSIRPQADRVRSPYPFRFASSSAQRA